MRELPRVNVSEDFYMWFDLEEKKEHYATPLYLYQVKRDRINPDDETKLYLKLEKDISKVKTGKDKEVIRHPSTIYIHYVENLGAMLINFLNNQLVHNLLLIHNHKHKRKYYMQFRS